MSPTAFGLTGKRVVAVVRAQGNITGGSKPQAGQITAEPLIGQLRDLADNPGIAGIVLRIDSPGAIPPPPPPLPAPPPAAVAGGRNHPLCAVVKPHSAAAA